MLRRRDVVALRAKHADRRPDIAEIDRGPVRHLDATGSEIVADEQFIDDELNLLGGEIDMSAPTTLEIEIALGFAIDLGEYVVLLAPKRIGGILVLEILHQPGAVELAATDVAGERRQPASSEQAARIAHRVFAMDAGPVCQRCSGHDHPPDQLTP